MNRLGLALALLGLIGCRAKPQPLQRAGFSLTIPAGWHVLTHAEDYDADHNFTLVPPSEHACQVMFDLDDEPANPELRVQKIAEIFLKTKPGLAKEPFAHWGTYDGSGLEMSDPPSAPERIRRRIFIHTGQNRSFTAMEVFYAEDQPQLQPALDQLAGSFRLVDHVTVGHD